MALVSRRTAALWAALLVAAPPALPQEAPAEYAVKAAFLYHFARYVNWPAPPGGEDAPFVISILGEDPFAAVIDDTLRGKTVDSRRILLRRVSRAEEVGTSQILFISSSEQAALPQILKRLEGSPTLTVGEMERFAESGGAIRFRTDNRRVRLEINPGAAEHAGLRISSELLKLARIVKVGG